MSQIKVILFDVDKTLTGDGGNSLLPGIMEMFNSLNGMPLQLGVLGSERSYQQLCNTVPHFDKFFSDDLINPGFTNNKTRAFSVLADQGFKHDEIMFVGDDGLEIAIEYADGLFLPRMRELDEAFIPQQGKAADYMDGLLMAMGIAEIKQDLSHNSPVFVQANWDAGVKTPDWVHRRYPALKLFITEQPCETCVLAKRFFQDHSVNVHRSSLHPGFVL